MDESDRTTGLMRLNAYKECCERLGISPCFQSGQLSYESAYHLTDKVLLAETQAIVCASDTLAMGVAKRLQELGRTDVQVSGVGATSLLSFLFPNTFSIDPGYYQAGAESARLLIRQLSEPAGITHLVQQASV